MTRCQYTTWLMESLYHSRSTGGAIALLHRRMNMQSDYQNNAIALLK
jgi:hypothetical protein